MFRPCPLLAALAMSWCAGLAACGGTGTSDDGSKPNAIAIASDSTGMKLVAVGGGGFWTSTNGGVSWVHQTPSGTVHDQNWMSVASDSTGSNLVAVASGFVDRPVPGAPVQTGDVWTSTNGGVTWIDRTASSKAHGLFWKSVASDSSGKNLVAVSSNAGAFIPSGAIWTSSDAGVTWTNRTAGIAAMGLQGWASVASDSAGKNLVAVGSQGIWTSIDRGLTWTDSTPSSPNLVPPPGQGWSSVASDATGTKLVVVMDTGDIWTTTDGGSTWHDSTPSGPAFDQIWFSVASDATGTNLVAVDALVNGNDGDVWTSTNGGQTWTDLRPHDAAASGPWTAVASSANGNHLVAVGPQVVWTN